MNAKQVIAEISRMPSEEKSKVVDFVRHLPNEETLAAMEEAKHPEKLDAYASADALFKALDISC